MVEHIRLPNGKAIDLVQRIEERKKEGKGVDKFFSFDYMGSSEFEFGGLGKSLARMREVGADKLQPKHVKFHYTGKGLPAYTPKRGPQVGLVETGKEFSFTYLGPEEFIPAVVTLFEKQAIQETCRLKERTDICHSYGLDSFYRDPRRDDLHGTIIGWWDIENDWVAFKNAKFAHLWLEGLRNK